MSPKAKLAVVSVLLGLAGSAAVGAVQVSGPELAALLLWALAVVCALAASGVVIPWRRLPSWLRTIGKKLAATLRALPRIRMRWYLADPRTRSRGASAESLERFRELWIPLGKAARFVEECLRLRAIELYEQPGVKKVVGLLLGPKLKEYRDAIARMEHIDSFQEVREQLPPFLSDYWEMANYWQWVESDLRGKSEYLESDTYRQFYERHEALSLEATKMRGRRDLGGMLAPDWLKPGKVRPPAGPQSPKSR